MKWKKSPFSSVQSLSRVQTFVTPWTRSTPGLPVHHQQSEFTQTNVHWVGDAIQQSHPLSSPSPPAPNPSQHQGCFPLFLYKHTLQSLQVGITIYGMYSLLCQVCLPFLSKHIKSLWKAEVLFILFQLSRLAECWTAFGMYLTNTYWFISKCDIIYCTTEHFYISGAEMEIEIGWP